MKPFGSLADFGELVTCAECERGTFWEDHTPIPTECEHCGAALRTPRVRKAVLGRRKWPVAKALFRGVLKPARRLQCRIAK